ncbi:phosphorylase family protein [Natronococcus occultus]|uniref:Purine nucleoside permease n=1 Tax=Natronococcus occultus SP4 TaxID=694430 RepID=L0JW14_9EURY|nr:purine nucleoside permease [Natronococcus occultus]AGB36495.1 purine nucleoside permease [Natronococcus occultus SP4]
MSKLSLPTPRPLDPNDPVRLAGLVLVAVAEPPLDERRPWIERAAIADALTVPGADAPLYLTDDGIAIATTGIGKSDAATTTAALLATPGLDLESAYVLSAGIAGGPPNGAPLGSVVLADAVVDWDRKHRWDGSDAPGERIDTLAYRPRDYVHHLADRVLEPALAAAEETPLEDDPEVRAYRERYPTSPDAEPTVAVGTTVCGDEFWHGPRRAEEVAWLCDAYGVGPYATTQMEDAATATALERFGLLDRYLSVRAVANYDRPAPGQSAAESFDGTDASLALAIENAERVGSTVLEKLLETDPLGIRP